LNCKGATLSTASRPGPPLVHFSANTGGSITFNIVAPDDVGGVEILYYEIKVVFAV
jgi:hypothetical protein